MTANSIIQPDGSDASIFARIGMRCVARGCRLTPLAVAERYVRQLDSIYP